MQPSSFDFAMTLRRGASLGAQLSRIRVALPHAVAYHLPENGSDRWILLDLRCLREKTSFCPSCWLLRSQQHREQKNRTPRMWKKRTWIFLFSFLRGNIQTIPPFMRLFLCLLMGTGLYRKHLSSTSGDAGHLHTFVSDVSYVC